MRESFDHEPLVVEARAYVERAAGYIATLHCGPLDYNVGQAADCLRAAALALEEFQRHRPRV